MNVFDISFDKMTVVGEMVPKKIFQFKQLLSAENVQMSDSFQDKVSDRVVGMFSDGLVYFEYDKLKGKMFNSRNFRMEFNPNKLESADVQWLQENIIPCLEDVGISRLDIAFDCDFDLSNYEFIPVGKEREKKETMIFGADKKLETYYIGSRGADKYVRIYDKKKERRENAKEFSTTGEWWRLEFELKREKINEFVEVFNYLQIKNPDLNQVEDIQDRMALYYLRDHKTEWVNLSKQYRDKLRKIRRNIKDENITPIFESALAKKKDELREQLVGWFENQYKVFDHFQ